MTDMGMAVLITGLPAAGKTTTARALEAKLKEKGIHRVTLLDGDVIRQHLSRGLGYSKEDRDTNIRRVGFVVGEIVKCDGIAICSLVAPYAESRAYLRSMSDRFVEVYLSTPLRECERRDPKGLYGRARRGEIEHFTGISDPYEEPENPELCFDTREYSPDEIAQEIIEVMMP